MSQLAQSVPIAHAVAPIVMHFETLLQRFLRGAWMDVLGIRGAGDITWLRAL